MRFESARLLDPKVHAMTLRVPPCDRGIEPALDWP